jgi:threonine aldolase
MNKKSFASDNWAPACPEVMQALIDANNWHSEAYGDDKYTKQAEELFKNIFGKDSKTYFVYNGTAANILSLSVMNQSFNAVICTEHAHINVDECGAVEKFVGTKLIDLPGDNGKLTISQIEPHIQALRTPHQVVPKVISISQPTELGTLYSIEEIRELADFAHSNNAYLHIDGARISNAVVALNTDFRTLITDTRVDVLSFGGTKNGMMFGEAVVILNPKLQGFFELYRKQFLQLASKMRFISAQFLALMKNDIWKKNAENSNKMALRLAEGLSKYNEVKITHPVETNGVWAILPDSFAAKLQQKSFFHPWDPSTKEYRIMTAFDTTEEEVDDFLSAIE